MKKKLFIHIGPGKSGTSAIQSFLSRNNDNLSKFNYNYPEIDSILESGQGRVTGGNAASLARSFLNDKHPFSIKDVEKKKAIQEKLKKVLNQSEYNLILSSELFSMLNKEEVFDLKKIIDNYNYDVRFICYLRRHDQIVESDYAQQVKKHGYYKDIDQNFYKHIINAYNFIRIINNYEDNFNNNSAEIRVYEKSQFKNGNILEDFLDAINLYKEKDTFIFNKGIVNPSPSRKMLEIMKIVNKINTNPRINEKLLDLVFKKEAFQKKTNENYIDYDSKKEILIKCNPMYTEIANKYFDRNILFKENLENYEINDLTNNDLVEVFMELL